MEWTFLARNEQETERLGAALARLLPGGTVVAMTGTLGAGKTRLVRAVAEASGVPRETVASPTFVLVREYKGSRPIFHFDTYRIKDEDEFLELGPEEYFYSEGLSFVEWAERMAPLLPNDRLDLLVSIQDDGSRLFQLKTKGNFPVDVLQKIESELNKKGPSCPGCAHCGWLLAFLAFFFFRSGSDLCRGWLS
ncbi:MAG: tRNA (adenosine(37)-N6)-threonylcarbamoyltransferase complex ATPase subunit type 1 TsaE [Planctomycetia bacterium]|nr:tRNA (adenosine(37)-N6)-threonylcarbamoyltransferase complex ATPase subunit type 1 TsaE [Planctomycetia bacterium]